MDCQSCAVQGRRASHREQLGLIPGAGLLEPAALLSLGSLPKTKSSNQLAIIFPEGYVKLKRLILVAKVASTGVATVLVDEWVVQYEIPPLLLTGIVRQSVAKLFMPVPVCLVIKGLNVKLFIPRIIESQTSQLTLVVRIWHWVADLQTIWNKYNQSLLYADIVQGSSSTGEKSFRSELSHQTPGMTTSNPSTRITDDSTQLLQLKPFCSWFHR